MMQVAKAPSGRDIWKAMCDELTLNLYPLPYSTLAPGVYHVYLHPEDYSIVEGIVPRIISQVQCALTAEVERMNKGSRGPGTRMLGRLLDREQPAPIEIPRPAGRSTSWQTTTANWSEVISASSRRCPCQRPPITAARLRRASSRASLGPEVERRVSGVRGQGSGIRDRDQGTGIRDQGSGIGIRDQGSGIRDQGSGIRDQGQGSGIRGQNSREPISRPSAPRWPAAPAAESV